jgi:hypothetical protein
MVLLEQGDTAGARAELRVAHGYWEKNTHPRWLALVNRQLGQVAQAEDRKEEARALFRISQEMYTGVGDSKGAAESGRLLAALGPTPKVASR